MSRRRNRLDDEATMREYTIGTPVHLRADKTRAVHTITHIVVMIDLFDEMRVRFSLDNAIHAWPFEVIHAKNDNEQQ